MKNFVTLIALTLLVLTISCKPKIEGRIVDNFDKPVVDVEISIQNSGFITSSKKDGSFQIEYASGKFALRFNKDNYLPITKTLEISESKKYPMGRIEMIRVPDTTGVFLKGENDFISIPQIELQEKPYKTNYGQQAIKVGHSYHLKENDIFIVKMNGQETFTFFDNTPFDTYLMETQDDFVAHNSISSNLSLGIYGNQVKGTASSLNSGLITREFSPQTGKKYVFISYESINYNTGQKMKKTAYALEFME